MSMYKAYLTDENAEKAGVYTEYLNDEGQPDFRVRLARAGGHNAKYDRVLEAKSKPYRRAAALGRLPDEKAKQIMREVFAETVVQSWETYQDGQWVSGIEGPDGILLPVTKENILATFIALPDVFEDIQMKASNMACYLKDVLETDAKN